MPWAGFRRLRLRAETLFWHAIVVQVLWLLFSSAILILNSLLSSDPPARSFGIPGLGAGVLGFLLVVVYGNLLSNLRSALLKQAPPYGN